MSPNEKAEVLLSPAPPPKVNPAEGAVAAILFPPPKANPLPEVPPKPEVVEVAPEVLIFSASLPPEVAVVVCSLFPVVVCWGFPVVLKLNPALGGTAALLVVVEEGVLKLKPPPPKADFPPEPKANVEPLRSAPEGLDSFWPKEKAPLSAEGLESDWPKANADPAVGLDSFWPKEKELLVGCVFVSLSFVASCLAMAWDASPPLLEILGSLSKI